ncbi:MAG TPA: methyltetrahydrofolate cobalamin methyltransferase [Oscillospiraceae bacterium]|nr:methyltetrahydrofolate cobalamin methyltransferase [Oscillospiraceae bacterium]
MIIIGEKINSTIKSVKEAIESSDDKLIKELAVKQSEANAAYIDVNAGTFYDNEPFYLEWLVHSVQEAVSTPLCIDSPNPKAISVALKANKNSKPIINSITAEKERYKAIMPLAVEYNTGIVALCMDDNGMPETVEDRVKIAENLIKNLTFEGIALNDIYIDPMVRPIGTGSHYGKVVFDTIRTIKQEYKNVHITCGLSNISYGLPYRHLLNQTFLVAAVAAGLDCAILDPLDKKLMSSLYAIEALLGTDDYCINYIEKFRDGELEL